MGLLDRVRSFVLGFAVLAAIPVFIALARAPRLPVSRAVGAVAVLALLATWGWTWRKKKSPPWVEGVTSLALMAVLNGVAEPAKVQGFFFAVLMYNGLYGGPLQLVLRLVLVQGAFFTHGDANPLSAIGFIAAGVVIWSLGRAIEQQNRLEARFRSLVTNASDMIVVVGDNGRISWQSPAVKRLLGRDLSDGEVSVTESLELRRADGVTRECRALITDLRADPNVGGMVLNIRDVTDQNRAARAERELEIASQLQTSLLPKSVRVPGFELAAAMTPADEIGGDYYDVLATPQGCLIGIGDVSGHGLTSGLIMLMLQSSIATLVRERPLAGPGELLVQLNEVLYDNIRNRLEKTEHVTMTLLKLDRGGEVTFAGAHEELIVQRRDAVEALPTPGTWLGALPNIASAIIDTKVSLQPGDVLLLHTDGVTEARNAAGEMYGMERLLERVGALHGKSPQELVEALKGDVNAWAPRRTDDVTLVAARYLG
ncbi:MAG: SpoIIE family protein phosphatase [Archangiaceae bacterium]|nr:SpoIIE family protein phosphatase [Archangiaceae bacterium]